MPHASVIPYGGKHPQLGNIFLASGAHIIGDVNIGDETSIWFNTTIRGDCHSIRIGARTNIQDNSVVHVTQGSGPTVIGSDITIGHGAIIHACRIDDGALIGMGAIVLDQAHIPAGCFVAAGSLVSPGKTFPPHYMIKGSPAVAVRPLRPEEIAGIRTSVQYYLDYSRNYMK